MLRRLLLTIFLGLAATIATSWACALWSPLASYTFHDPAPPGPYRARFPRDWTVRTWLERRGPGFRHDTISECEWMGSRLGASTSTFPNRTRIVASVGLPFPAMQWTAYDSRDPRGLWHSGFALPPMRLARSWPESNLPLRPLWIPFALNTLLFAGAIHGTLALIAELRRRHRRRRGRCPSCGYALGGLATCPECGM
jgi:hypothetical protein